MRANTSAVVICEQTIYDYFRIWRLDGTWMEIHARLRELARLHAM